jgi:glycogen operon protein
MNWGLGPEERDLFRFFRNLIHFRRRHPLVRRDCFEPWSSTRRVEMHWHGTRLQHADWSQESRALALQLRGTGDGHGDDNIFIIANAYWDRLRFELPKLDGARWARFLDTMREPPRDIAEVGQELLLEDERSYTVEGRSVVVLVGVPSSR